MVSSALISTRQPQPDRTSVDCSGTRFLPFGRGTVFLLLSQFPIREQLFTLPKVSTILILEKHLEWMLLSGK